MNYYMSRLPEDELYHHGVKGMKWGVRKKRPNTMAVARNRSEERLNAIDSEYRNTVKSAKKQYKAVKKEYSRAYNDAYKYSSRHPIGQWTNKNKSAEADRRWEKAIDKADAANKAKSQYKQIKRDAKQRRSDQYEKADAQTYKELKKVKYRDIGTLTATSTVAGLATYAAGKALTNRGHDFAGAILEGAGEGMVNVAVIGGTVNTGMAWYAKKFK